MTEVQRIKLQDLRSRNQYYVKQQEQKKNALLQECLDALREYTIITDETEISRILQIANGTDVIRRSHAAKPSLIPNHVYYVVWDDAQAPFIECIGTRIMAEWDEVIAVAFDTCFIDKVDQKAILIRG